VTKFKSSFSDTRYSQTTTLSTNVDTTELWELCGVGVEVSYWHCPRLPLWTLRSCCLCFRSSAFQVSVTGLTASS